MKRTTLKLFAFILCLVLVLTSCSSKSEEPSAAQATTAYPVTESIPEQMSDIPTNNPSETITSSPIPESTDISTAPFSENSLEGYTGLIVTFGSYEQDNNFDNGKEPIEWIVLSNDGEKLLLLSKYALEFKRFNEKKTAITWENCTLRSWLNSEFYNSAFNDREKALIIKSYLENHNNPKYDTYGGNDTYDNVFLLSADDVLNTEYGFSKEYKSENGDIARRCAPTAYVLAQCPWVDTTYPTKDYESSCYWYLRTPGERDSEVTNVIPNGRVNLQGNDVGDLLLHTIRPAIYIELTNEINEKLNKQRIEDIQNLIPTAVQDPSQEPIIIRSDIKQGDIVVLGSFEQDNNFNNGKEPIEWVVLSNDGKEALLFSKYVLDVRRYNETKEDTTWATCTLRSWLNNDFYNYAFNDSEKEIIKTAHLKNENNPYFNSVGGPDTDDKVFLLSLEDMTNTSYGFKDYDAKERDRLTSAGKSDEMWNYIRDFNRRRSSTKYAKASDIDAVTGGERKRFILPEEIINKDMLFDRREFTGGIPESEKLAVCGDIWLRSPGFNNAEAVFFFGDGSISEWGMYVDEGYGICPAIVISLK
ncbi:MAG: hypothetical protein IKP88_11005 [Lachnospiraceae bacterium]|nr:hypothetical protein [Lachnospiraceae bacterium]